MSRLIVIINSIFFKLPEEAQTMISDRKKIKQAADFPEYCDAIVKKYCRNVR
jgi:hypothetical protein